MKVFFNPGKNELKQVDKLKGLLEDVEILLLNREESEILFNLSFDDILSGNLIHQLNLPVVAVTAGADGAYVFSDNHQFYSPAVNHHPVDETGAGDSFGSTFIAALIHQKSPQDALFWAVKNSASAVSLLGSKSGLLTLKQIKD